jgi:hypothetical protein
MTTTKDPGADRRKDGTEERTDDEPHIAPQPGRRQRLAIAGEDTMETTHVERRKKRFFDHLKTVHDIIDGLGTLLKTGILLVAAVVSLLGYLDKTNRLNVVGPSEIAIANVYNQPQTVAQARLEDQGFIAPAIYRVCSSSVGADHVRQVVQKTNGREVILVDKGGTTEAGRGLQTSATIAVKVSTGVSCR